MQGSKNNSIKYYCYYEVMCRVENVNDAEQQVFLTVVMPPSDRWSYVSTPCPTKFVGGQQISMQT